jgi:hypothetical protein
MSSSAIVDGRDIAGGRALVKETRRIAREAIAQRTAARVKKILSTPTNTVVDLYPGSGSWELHSRSGALTFVRGATELLTATETPPGSNQWVLEYVAPVTEVTEVIDVDLESPRDDRAIPEPIDDQGPD